MIFFIWYRSCKNSWIY